MSLKGIHFGKLNVGNQQLQLLSMNNQKMFGLSFQNMNNVAVNKNDIIIQTNAEQVGDDDCMCQIRFYVDQPKQQNSMDEQENNEQKQQKDSYAQTMYKTILEKAKIGQYAGQSIATLIDVNLAVPRGKYTIDFYKKNFRLHGASYSYNVDYKHVMKGFVLPMTNQAQVSIVLQLNKDKPIYQGQTVYNYIVIQVKKDLEVQIKTKINPQIVEDFPHLKQLKPEYNGYLFQVFVDLIQACSKISIIHPGANFKSRDGQPCVKCNVKAQPGWLYFMKQSLMFIIKPVIYFKTDQIRNIQFTRTSVTNKQFDMKIILKDEKKKGVEFMGIQRPQLDALLQYFKERSVKIDMETEQVPANKSVVAGVLALGEDDDQSDDQDFDADQDQSDSDQSDQDQDLSGQGQESSHKQKEKNKKPKKQDN